VEVNNTRSRQQRLGTLVLTLTFAALHYAYVRVTRLRANPHSIMNGSTDVLEHILNHDSCDPDIRNRLAGDTPLHIAVRQKWEDHPGMRLYLGALGLTGGSSSNVTAAPWSCASCTVYADTAVGSLLEAGADQLCVPHYPGGSSPERDRASCNTC